MSNSGVKGTADPELLTRRSAEFRLYFAAGADGRHGPSRLLSRKSQNMLSVGGTRPYARRTGGARLFGADLAESRHAL
jgi:hypothetical protein